MHIPNGMLHGEVCPVSAVVAAGWVGFAAWRAFLSKDKPFAGRFAAVTALIFAAQMMNFPINGGTSGHLVGGVLATALLGIPFGILSMALVVTIQCLVFADGGFSVLGANIFNMALMGAGLGGFIYSIFSRRFSLKTPQAVFGLGLAAWFSVMLSALFCAIELSISGTIPFFRVVGAMLSTHSFIGIGEGIITVAACFAFASETGRVTRKRTVTAPLLASGIIAVVLSPWACGFPDGLEWVALKFKFLHESAPTFVTPLADYSVGAFNNEMFAGSFAGLAGVIITFIAAWITAKLLNKPAVCAEKV